MEGEWVGDWWRVGAINEGGRNTLPKIFSGFSEGGCWLIIDRLNFGAGEGLEGSYSICK